MRRSLLVGLLSTVLAACAATDAPTAATLAAPATPLASVNRGAGDLTVMTYNIYQGTDLDNTLAATTPTEFVMGITADFADMRRTNFTERAAAIAREVAASQPDLIGLQEVALWRTGPHTEPATPASAVVQDFLTVLLDALDARGLHYSTVVFRTNLDVQGPALSATGLFDVRLTDRNVILARTDGEAHALKPSNARSGHFVTHPVVQTPAGPVPALEGWASIDVTSRGQTVRFITTHLDAFSPLIRAAQAAELLAGPANTSMPVIMAGDMNILPSASTYAAIISAGFQDAWTLQHPTDDGFTCCEAAPTIVNPLPTLFERIDYAVFRGNLDAVGIDRVGATPDTRTVSGLWPSDHAGLVARFVAGPR